VLFHLGETADGYAVIRGRAVEAPPPDRVEVMLGDNQNFFRHDWKFLDATAGAVISNEVLG
jgi:hypothetical protein